MHCSQPSVLLNKHRSMLPVHQQNMPLMFGSRVNTPASPRDIGACEHDLKREVHLNAPE